MIGQDRFEDMADLCVHDWYVTVPVHLADNERLRLTDAIAALVRREVDAARAGVAANVEALPRFHLMRDLDSGCCHASMLGFTEDGPWISRNDVLAAILAGERRP